MSDQQNVERLTLFKHLDNKFERRPPDVIHYTQHGFSLQIDFLLQLIVHRLHRRTMTADKI